MADYNINAVTRRVVFTGSAGVGPYAFSFEILDQNDLAVYFNTTVLTLTTDYTVTINANGTGSVTIVTGTNVPSTPTASDTIIIIGARDIERVTDFVTAGDLLASSLNEQLDALTIFDQQLAEEGQRSMRAPVYDPALVADGGTLDMTLPPVADRIDTVMAFDSDGNPVKGPTVSGITTITALAADITTLADIEDGTVATDAISDTAAIAANVTTVAGISGNVTTVAGISSDVTAVAADATDIGTVATNIANVNSVAAIDSDVTAVAGISAGDLSTVAGISANVTTVAGISSNVTTVAGVSANVTTVAGISADVTTVAGDSADIQSVAADAADIGTVATNIADVSTVATDIANVNTTASNITGVNSFAERYRVAASDPVTSLDAGDLAFNTTDSALKYYNGTSWASITAGLTDIVADVTPQLGGDLDVNGNSIVSISNGDIAITPNGTGSVVIDGLNYPQADGSAGQFLKTDGAGNLAFDSIVSFDSGTLMLFQQTAAPTGWTKQTTHNDKALRVVNGTAGSGGSSAFTTAFATPSVSGTVSLTGEPGVGNLAVTVSGNIANTTLSTSQIASHSHSLQVGNGNATNTNRPRRQNDANANHNTANTGGGGSHNHAHNLSGNVTGAPGVGTLAGSLSSATADVNVQYVDLIIASKD